MEVAVVQLLAAEGLTLEHATIIQAPEGEPSLRGCWHMWLEPKPGFKFFIAAQRSPNRPRLFKSIDAAVNTGARLGARHFTLELAQNTSL
jgi:hypothetical protein